MTIRPMVLVLVLAALLSAVASASALDRLCDPQMEDCRAPILHLIRQETSRIDVAFWYMTDARYAANLIKRFKAGVQVRVLVDPQSSKKVLVNAVILKQIEEAGIPMRYRKSGGILHWKVMLFDGQNVVHFSKANFTPASYVPMPANVNYFDEAVYFTDRNEIVNTFRTKFDNLWTNTHKFANYANVTLPTRAYGSGWELSPSLNLPPGQDFATRSMRRYNAEPTQIDVMVYRATDDRHADAMIAAVGRGVRVRLITEPKEYRAAGKYRHAYNMDRMYQAGVEIKHRQHRGFLHEAAVILHGLGEVIFGSSNWSPASSNSQYEHNFFYTPGMSIRLDSGESFYEWFRRQFTRKWTDEANYVAFQPLTPGRPAYRAPLNGADGIGRSVTLTWEGGPWAWQYDVRLGTSPRLSSEDTEKADVRIDPSDGPERLPVWNLRPGTTYYWQVVSKTMARQTSAGPVWSFTTEPE